VSNTDRLEAEREAAVSTTAGSNTAARASRERAVEDAIHSGEMEGLTVGTEFENDAAAYASGAIDLDEFGRRVRTRNVEDAVHSAAMESLTVTPATRAEADRYAAGEIDVDDLIALVQARYPGVK
jgi:hypothetical protein